MATLIVTNTNDAGAGSLRQAVMDANASVLVADTIVFAGGLAGQTITLTSGELVLSDDVTFDGDANGDNKADITISGNNASRIFSLSGVGTDVDLLSLTLTNGFSSAGGGAIYASFGGSLAIFDSTITNSVAKYGGGILSGSATTLNNSLVSNNTATSSGGGIAQSTSSLTLVNSTIDGNTTNGYGGGIGGNSPQVNIINSTITNNHADIDGSTAASGGAIGVVQFNGSAIINVTNSVIAQNTSGLIWTVNDMFNTVNSATNSVFGTAVTITTNTLSLTNVSPIDIGLGALGDHGGTTLTRDIASPTSVLINAGSNSAAAGITTDANGNARIQGGTVDIGATEYNILTVTNLNASGAGSLSEAIDLANAKVGADHIVFQAGLTGQFQPPPR